MTGILIAEAEARIASFLEKGLRASGFSIGLATEGDEVVRLADSGRYALLVLDLDIPGAARVVHELRQRPAPLPVVALTGRYRAGDRRGGSRGGVDYVSKPFRFEELLERIAGRLGDEGVQEPRLVRVGDVALDPRTRTATVGARSVQLSAREFDLALTFLRRPGHVLTREELLATVWGHEFDPRSNVIDVYVGYLRRKLGRERITSIRRVGYRFETHVGDGADRPANGGGGRGRSSPARPWLLAMLGGGPTSTLA